MNKRIKILLIEDDEDDYVITSGLLSEVENTSYAITWMKDPLAALGEMQKNNHDVYLVDYQLGTYIGTELIKKAKLQGCDGPFIMLTGQTELDIDLKAMNVGVSDFLIKGTFNALLLERTIRYVIKSKITEKELRNAEEKYRSYFENTIEGIFQTSLTGKVITANPALAQICGYKSPEELKKSLNNIEKQLYVKPKRRAEFMRNVKKKNNIINFESEIYRKDGSIIWISENARTVKDPFGKILYFEGTVRDITIRKKVEEERAKLLHEQIAREESEKNNEKTTMLLTITSMLSEALTPESVAEVLIEKGVKLLGAKAGSMVLLKNNDTMEITKSVGYPKTVMESWINFSVNIDVPMAISARTKKPLFIPSRNHAEKHYTKFAEKHLSKEEGAWACLPMISKNKVMGVIGISYNSPQVFNKAERTFLLTLAQQGVQALERSLLYDSERKARKISEKSQVRLKLLNDASKMLSVSLDYKITLYNVARSIVPNLADWCTIDIVTEDEEIQNIALAHIDKDKVKLAQEFQKLYPPTLGAKTGLAQVIRNGKSELYAEISPQLLAQSARDKKHLDLMNKLGIYSVMMVPLVSHKKTLGAISLISSSSEKIFDNEDLLFAEELAHRAAMAIDNAKLFEKAQEGIRVRDEFLNIASHELKTPLTSLQLQMQFLIKLVEKYPDMIPSSQLTSMLGNSTQQIKRLTNLINNLLDVSRISAKKLELDIEEVNLNHLLTDIVNRFEDTTKMAGTKIDLHNGQVIVGKWDKFRIDQVATNLIANAIKYGRGNPIKIYIDRDNELAKISVKDQGIGITEEDAKKIFNRFVRTSSAREYGGLGLGLYIAKQIVEAHGGSIDVKSEFEKGSIFTVNLPLSAPN